MFVVVERSSRGRQEAGVRRNQCEGQPAQDDGGTQRRRGSMNRRAVMSVGGSAGVREGACGGRSNVEGEGVAGGSWRVPSGRFKGAHGSLALRTDKPTDGGEEQRCAQCRAAIRAAVGGERLRRGGAAKWLFQGCVLAGWLV